MIYVDAMHGKLARILRVFGVSCVYLTSDLTDNQIVKLLKDNDVLITSDLELSKRVKNAIYLDSKDLKTNLEKIVNNGIRLDIQNPYCYLCNVKLERIGNKYRCPSCNRFYWRGKQWSNLKKYLPSELQEFSNT
ncbi:MAG: Mut7-C RNAse domain-containing protein [Candidatus Anstonellales archaeon]